MKPGNKLSRRKFISYSSFGIINGIPDSGHKNQAMKTSFSSKLSNNPVSGNSIQERNRVIHLHPSDNVAVALEDLSGGTKVTIDNLTFVLGGDTAAKHKFSLSDIAVGEPIYMYGIKVGTAVKAIPKGTAITVGNTINNTSDIQRNGPKNFKWTPPEIEAFRTRSFLGYHRPDGKVGTANYWIVIPMVFCENHNVEVIKDAVLSELGYQQVSPYQQFTRDLIANNHKENSVKEATDNFIVKNRPIAGNAKLFENVTGIRFLTHSGGCGGTRQDSETLCGLLAGYITHPNVAGATVLSLGCQNAQLSSLQREIKKRDPDFSKPYFEFEQQKIGTEDEMIRQAIQSVITGLKQADQITRKPAPLSKLCIGLECGGSDGFSGISANPAIGFVSDMIVALGGSTVLSEFPELSGVEQNLYDRCTNQQDADKFLDLMQTYSAKAKYAGSGFDMNPSPGNIKDGLITDAMKSAGAAKKGGTSPVTGVLDYHE